jgi:hypothetical protein
MGKGKWGQIFILEYMLNQLIFKRICHLVMCKHIEHTRPIVKNKDLTLSPFSTHNKKLSQSPRSGRLAAAPG